MYYVSWIREYPIYEPAEGGYYYAGEQVFLCNAYPTWKQANRAFKKLRREFLDYCGWADEGPGYLHHERDVYAVDCGGVGKYKRPMVKLQSDYVGKEEWIQITRRKPNGCGRQPYC